MTGQQIDRDQLRELAENATPGPWIPHPSYVWTSELGGIIQNWSEDANAAADMEFIAASREAVPALLDALCQAEAEVKRLSWKCGHLADKYAQDTDELRQEADQAEARIQAVRELHKRGEVMAWFEDCTDPEAHDCMDDPHGGGTLCTDEILGHYCHGCAPEDASDVTEYPWPCPTIRALDGEA